MKSSTSADLPCVACVGGKLALHTFLDEGSDIDEALVIVHIDLSGPFWVAAKDGSLYFLLLKDWKTCYVWVKPVAKKSDVLRVFEKWLTVVERQTKMTTLPTDSSSVTLPLLAEVGKPGDEDAQLPPPTIPPAMSPSATRRPPLHRSSSSTFLERVLRWPPAMRGALVRRLRHRLVASLAPERLSYHACLPPAAYTTLLDDSQAGVDLLELDPDLHANPEHRWDIATMTVKEALASWKGKAVKAAMHGEIRSLIANDTWELVERSCGINLIKNHRVMMKNYHVDNTVAREKACLVVKGFTHVYGTDYDETYAPVRSYSLRIFLIIVAVLDLLLMQPDMENAFM
ncbi:unnamed protein product [Closterium sp. NIES-54]